MASASVFFFYRYDRDNFHAGNSWSNPQNDPLPSLTRPPMSPRYRATSSRPPTSRLHLGIQKRASAKKPIGSAVPLIEEPPPTIESATNLPPELHRKISLVALPSPGLNIDASMSFVSVGRSTATTRHVLARAVLSPSASVHVSSCRSSSPFHLRRSLKLVAANSTSPPPEYCSPRVRRRESVGRDVPGVHGTGSRGYG